MEKQTQSSKKVRKGDMVQIIAGREKGKTGKVLRLLSGSDRLFVEKLNMVKRHTKPTQKNPQGGIVEKEASLHVSNVLLLCPKCNKGVRVAVKVKSDKKTRECKKCGESLN
ncbi:MAG: 50S ribosomal protein L24 [Bacteriovoracia bacterium]